jgi:uncharacterized membrane protein YkoI
MTTSAILRSRVPLAGVLAGAVLALGAGSAAAAPVVESIDVDRVSATRARVDVDVVRSSVAARPQARVTIRGRSAALRTTDWAVADETMTLVGSMPLRVREGQRVRVRVRVCDRGSCTTVSRRVVVEDLDADRDGDRVVTGSGSSAGGAVGRAEAARIAQARFGGRVEAVSLEDDFGGRWEVELEGARLDGAVVDLDVHVSARGEIVRVIVDEPGRSGDRERGGRDGDGWGRHHSGPGYAVGGVSAERAAEVAQARFGGRVVDVDREDDHGAIWEVELEGVRATDTAAAGGGSWSDRARDAIGSAFDRLPVVGDRDDRELDVLVGADGRIVRVERG